MTNRVLRTIQRAAEVARRRARSPLFLALACIGLLAAAKLVLMLDQIGADQGVQPPGAAAPLASVGEPFWPEEPEPAAGPDDEEAPFAPDQPDLKEWTQQTLPVPPRLAPESLTMSEIELLRQLSTRRSELEERERRLEMRETLLDAAEARLARQLEELTRLKTTIESMVEQKDGAEKEKVQSLVKIYESMKPKAAAEIFDRLEMNVLLEVVSGMREMKSSAVIARMDPQKAKVLTAELARRQQQLPATRAEGSGG